MSAEPKSAGERKPRSVFKKVKNAFKLRRGSRRGSPSRPQHIDTADYGTPPRRKFPTEIQVVPGTPDSLMSGVSGVTGMPEPGISMFSSVLPSLKSDDSMQSISFFDPLSPTGKNPSNNNISFKREPPARSKSILQSWFRASSFRPSIKRSWFTESQYFKNLIEKVFKNVDMDNSGSIDKKEMYSALLLVHLKLATCMGPAACKPPTRKYVNSIFDHLDIDKSGELEREEFACAMTILCSQITSRVFIQWTMVLMIVPFISKMILDCLVNLIWILRSIWIKVDQYEEFTEYVETFARKMVTTIFELMPSKVQQLLATLPVDIMSSIPLTIVSSLLGTILVPYLIFKCDEAFHKMAAKKKNASALQKVNN